MGAPGFQTLCFNYISAVLLIILPFLVNSVLFPSDGNFAAFTLYFSIFSDCIFVVSVSMERAIYLENVSTGRATFNAGALSLADKAFIAVMQQVHRWWLDLPNPASCIHIDCLPSSPQQVELIFVIVPSKRRFS